MYVYIYIYILHIYIYMYGRLPMDLGIPRLRIENPLESNPLTGMLILTACSKAVS